MARPRRVSDMSPGYWTHASHKSMAVYLADAERDLRDLTKLRDRLQAAHDERKGATERGEWPPTTTPPTDTPKTEKGDTK